MIIQTQDWKYAFLRLFGFNLVVLITNNVYEGVFSDFG